ncbi:MAG: hydrogenase small subunit [Candidatus Omnitrophota bacterium]|nr:hydrogenase small subunit [bacterium]MBU4123468.1 hydrogenase small subunit [bacterium]
MATINVIWYAGASCSGCSVSVLNSVSPDIKEILLAELVPGKSINLLFQPTVMAAGGELAAKILEDAPKTPGYVLIMEGALPKGEISEGFCKLVPDCMAVIALGSCAAFGNIPKASPNPSGSVSVGDCFRENKIEKPLINIPGCPPHPDWFAGTVFHILYKGIPELDSLNRPKLFYGGLIHENCERRPYFDKGKFAKKFTDEGCLFELGCKGPYTNADCSIRSWNNKTNWCIQNGHPCIGCTEPEFPDVLSPLYEPLKLKK